MKLISAVIFFLITSITFGQDFQERHPELSEFVETINSRLPTYETISLENEEFIENMTDGGGILKGYFLGNEIQKIVIWVGVSNGKYEFDYYFRNSKLFYMVESFKQFAYDADSDTWDYSTLKRTFRGDYLFYPTFDYETIGHNRFENDELDPEQVLSEEAEEYLKLLQEKRN